MNETNRSVIILLAGLGIILMGVLIFATWAADEKAVDQLGDFVEYLDSHRDDPGRLILTLGALAVAVLALLLIIVELAPEEEPRELTVEQADTTTVLPAAALRERLEEALLALPQVTEARARIFSRNKGLGTSLEITIGRDANVAAVTQEATRTVADTLKTDLGLPVVGVPSVRIAFGGTKTEAVASSTLRPPLPADEGTAAPDSGKPPQPNAGAVDELPDERPQP